ncbi:MAG: hypothetical protein MUF34_33575, partial [Polyangiaceae bacterium]|nr:hypothetical protein [Polyangiaceae bacterium]
LLHGHATLASVVPAPERRQNATFFKRERVSTFALTRPDFAARPAGFAARPWRSLGGSGRRGARAG